jgi:hypothetical protein
MRASGPCSVCGEQKFLTRGMCAVDYRAAVKAERFKQPCEVEGCTTGVKSSGLCAVHYDRQRKYRRAQEKAAFKQMQALQERNNIIKQERDRAVAIINFYKYRGSFTLDDIAKEIQKSSGI